MYDEIFIDVGCSCAESETICELGFNLGVGFILFNKFCDVGCLSHHTSQYVSGSLGHNLN